MQTKEYEVVRINTPNMQVFNNTLNSFARQGWTLKHVNEDFTLFIFERDVKPRSEFAPVGVKAVSEDIRKADTQEVVEVSHVASPQPVHGR